jgi:hypothetical protein
LDERSQNCGQIVLYLDADSLAACWLFILWLKLLFFSLSLAGMIKSSPFLVRAYPEAFEGLKAIRVTKMALEAGNVTDERRNESINANSNYFFIDGILNS